MGRNDSTCKPQVFPPNTHIVLPVAKKLGCFLSFSDSRSHILIKTNPQYTIFELIKTSLSVVLFHFLPQLNWQVGGAYQLTGHMTITVEHAWSLLTCQTNLLHNLWVLERGRSMLFFHMEGKTQFINIKHISQNRPSLRAKRLRPP